jgi:copper resistance protein D
VLPDLFSVTVRALSFVLILQAAGVALFVAVFGRELVDSSASVHRVGVFSAAAGVLLVLLHYGLEAARMTGEISGAFDPGLQAMVAASTSAVTGATRVLGLLLIAAGLRRPGDLQVAMTTVGATLIAVSFLLTGHTTAHEMRWMLSTLLAVHLIVVAFWFGALVPLYLVSLRETPQRAARLAQAFSRSASWLVPIILIAGLVMAIVLLPDLSALRQPYGALLLAKLVAFGVLMGLAAANKWRLAPALARGEARAFRHSLAAEFLLIVAVLAITAVMTSFFSPEA